ncbi:hypothetical protein [Kitasatospora sp. NPDC059599]|uniref:hypothetical protein n=1 Tax=Kitasatospora sp. NPDC059599 TaxID=3346880 RepID=UPI0036B05794
MHKTARPALVLLLAVVGSLLGVGVAAAADAADAAGSARPAVVTGSAAPQSGDSMGWE